MDYKKATSAIASFVLAWALVPAPFIAYATEGADEVHDAASIDQTAPSEADAATGETQVGAGSVASADDASSVAKDVASTDSPTVDQSAATEAAAASEPADTEVAAASEPAATEASEALDAVATSEQEEPAKSEGQGLDDASDEAEDMLEESDEELSAQADRAGAWRRLWGGSAYGTMSASVRADGVFSGTGGTVVVATGDGYWDALAASGLAGLYKAPVLITERDKLTAETKAEIDRLRPSRILVMGGELVVTPRCFQQIQALCPQGTTRVWGGDAQATAVKIYEAGSSMGWGDTAILATSDGYWDALSIAPYAYAHHAPIFLTASNENSVYRVPSQQTLDAIREGGFRRVIIVGGELAVFSTVEGSLRMYGASEVKRLAGGGALDTSVKIARWEVESEGMNIDHLSVATSNGYWDALTGAALAGRQGSALVLVSPEGDCRALDEVYAYERGSIAGGYVFGGTLAVSDAAWTRITSSWGLGGLQASSDEGRLGTTFGFDATMNGNAPATTYRYTWSLDGTNEKGSVTGGAHWSFTPAKRGTYTISVTVDAPGGTTASKSTSIRVWAVDDLNIQTEGTDGWTVALSSQENDPTASGLTYRYSWRRVEDGASGVIADWTGATRVALPRAMVDGKEGMYDVTVEERSASGAVARYTKRFGSSGDAILDAAVGEIIDTRTGRGSDALEKAYLYIAYEYGTKNGAFPVGSWTEWSKEFAIDMYQNGFGNCYGYAAIVTWVARGLGYDAHAVSGRVKSAGGWAPHAWCMVKQADGERLVDSGFKRTYPTYDFFMDTYDTAHAIYEEMD